MPPEAGIAPRAFPAGVRVSRETSGRLAVYAALLRKWAPALNLVAPSTLDSVWERHFADSAQLPGLAPAGWRSWLDMGSGAGFPGLVVAVLADAGGGRRVTLVESDQRKCAFLQEVARAVAAPVEIVQGRVEAMPEARFDVVSARALAPLDRLLAYAEPRVGAASTCLFLKGASHAREVAAARRRWRFDLEVIPSRTGSDGVVLRIGGLARDRA
jgi:16S rRNA (guanine527-N7)-methyltransferase